MRWRRSWERREAGVVAFAVAQQAREIGIRAALGANRRRVVGRFFGRGMRLGLAGLMLGLPFGLLSLRVLGGLLEAQPANTTTLAALIAGFVLGVSCLATWIPARRAAGVDPLIALRSE